MKIPRRRKIVFALIAAALHAAAIILIAYRDYHREVNNHRRVMSERGQLVLDSLAAGTRAHGRMGRTQAERLNVIFEELAGTAGVVAVALQTSDGRIIASGGDIYSLPSISAGEEYWTECCFVVAAERAPTTLGFGPRRGGGQWPEGRMQGMGPDFNEPRGAGFAGGPYVMVAALDASDVLNQISREWARFLFTSALIAAAVFLAGLVAFSWLERRRLAADLAVASERAAQNERLAQLGAGLAHETKNPLGLVRGLAQAITESPQEAKVKQLAGSIVDETDRTVGQINSFLSLARPKEPDLANVNLDTLFSELLPLVQPDADAARAKIRHNPSKLCILADRELLRRALLNILLNAVRAVNAPGQIDIETKTNGAAASLSIKDNGVGISPEDLPRVTEPYFSRFEGGCGLGLAVTDQIARAHGWRLRVHSKQGEGSVVTLEGMRRAT